MDSLELYRCGLESGITVAPGYVFAPGPHYRNYIRLNAAMLVDEAEWAVTRLGKLAQELTITHSSVARSF